MILAKLRYHKAGGSEKHPRDIASMLVIQGTALDRTYVESWAARLGLMAEWEAVRHRVADG